MNPLKFLLSFNFIIEIVIIGKFDTPANVIKVKNSVILLVKIVFI